VGHSFSSFITCCTLLNMPSRSDRIRRSCLLCVHIFTRQKNAAWPSPGSNLISISILPSICTYACLVSRCHFLNLNDFHVYSVDSNCEEAFFSVNWEVHISCYLFCHCAYSHSRWELRKTIGHFERLI
jgi:hypothetical protein